MLKAVKRSALLGAKATGLFGRLAASSWRQGRLLVLCYHGVSLTDEHEWDPALYMSPAQFDRRMATLKAGGYCVLPLAEALSRLEPGTLPKRSVAITFDDGTWDFYRQAYPVLKKYGFPVTVYLTTYYCYDNRPVFDVFVGYLLWKSRPRVVEANPRAGIETRADLSTPEGISRARDAILDFAERNRLSADAKDELARELAHELGLSYEELARQRILHIMRPEEVSQLAAGGVDFELHTHRHRVPRRRDLFAREIEDNRASLQELTGKTAVHLCYPSGEYYDDFFPWLRELGVKSATTCNPGLVTRNLNPLAIPRLVDVSTLNDVEFEGWLSGVSSFLPRRRRPLQG